MQRNMRGYEEPRAAGLMPAAAKVPPGEADSAVMDLEDQARASAAGFPQHHCRGVASVYIPVHNEYKVHRVYDLRRGYCRRTACECCAPPQQAQRPGVQDRFCSCRAVPGTGGLCRRCYVDYYAGSNSWSGDFLGAPGAPGAGEQGGMAPGEARLAARAVRDGLPRG